MTYSLDRRPRPEQIGPEIVLGDNSARGRVACNGDIASDLLRVIEKPGDELLTIPHISRESGLRTLELDGFTDQRPMRRFDSGGGVSVRQEIVPVEEVSSYSTRKLVATPHHVNKETCVSLHKRTGKLQSMGIAENLKRLREDAGLSQAKLARLAKVTQQLISQIEAGTNSSTKNLPAIATALGRNIWEIDPNYVAAPVKADRVPLLSWTDVAQMTRTGSEPSFNVQQPSVTVGDLPQGLYFAVRAEDQALDRVVPQGATMIANLHDTNLESGRYYVFYDEEHGNAFARRFHDDPPLLEPVSTQSLYRPHALRPTIRTVARVEMVISLL